MITNDRVLIISAPLREDYFDVSKITSLSFSETYDEVYISYERSSYSFRHPKGYKFLYDILKPILRDLKLCKIDSQVVEIEEG